MIETMKVVGIKDSSYTGNDGRVRSGCNVYVESLSPLSGLASDMVQADGVSTESYWVSAQVLNEIGFYPEVGTCYKFVGQPLHGKNKNCSYIMPVK